MIAHQNVIYNVTGQSLYLDCPDGRPSSITSVTVYPATTDDDGTTESATTGSAAVETNPNTTVDIASGASEANPKRLYVTATTGAAVGQRLLVTSGLGHHELVEVAGIASGDYLTLKHPLLNDYEVTDSTVQSVRCSISVDSTWVADEAHLTPTGYGPNGYYRVRWVVVVGGATKVYERYFDLVRYPATHNVQPLDVEQRQPGWLDALGPDDRADQGRSLIDRADLDLKFELAGDNKADQAIRNPEMYAELVIARTVHATLYQRAIAGAPVTATQLEVAERNWRQRYDQFVRSPVIAVDVGSGASAPVRPQPLWRR